jgi:hypothetical protein
MTRALRSQAGRFLAATRSFHAGVVLADEALPADFQPLEIEDALKNEISFEKVRLLTCCGAHGRPFCAELC